MKKQTPDEVTQALKDGNYSERLTCPMAINIMYLLFQGDSSPTELKKSLDKIGSRKGFNKTIFDLKEHNLINERKIEHNKDMRKQYYVSDTARADEAYYKEQFERNKNCRSWKTAKPI